MRLSVPVPAAYRVARALLTAPVIAMLPIGHDICLGWIDGFEDLDACCKLGNVPFGIALRHAAIALGLVALLIPRRLLLPVAIGVLGLITTLTVLCLVSLRPIAAIDVRVAALFVLAAITAAAAVLTLATVRRRELMDYGPVE